MSQPRSRVARAAVLAATTGLLTSGIACLASGPAHAAAPTGLGFDVSALAVAPDGTALAVGNEYTEDGVRPHAAFVRSGKVTALDLPAGATVTSTAWAHGQFAVGGDLDGTARVWLADPENPTEVPDRSVLDWSSVQAVAADGDTTAVAGTRNDETDGRQAVVAVDGLAPTVLAGTDSVVDLAVDAPADGGTPTAYALSSAYDEDTDTSSGVLWVTQGDGAPRQVPLTARPVAVAEVGGTAFVAADVETEGHFGGKVDEVDADGEVVASVDFADMGWVHDVQVSADGKTLYVSTSYRLFAVPVADFASFDPASAPVSRVSDADGQTTRLGRLAVLEGSTGVTAYAVADDSSVGEMTAPTSPSFTAAVDPWDPTAITVTLPADVADASHLLTLTAGGKTVEADDDDCAWDDRTATSTCTFVSLQRGVAYDVTVAVTNALGTGSATTTVRTPGVLAGPASVTFTGTAQVGATLTANVGVGWPAGTTFAYAWGWSGGERGDLLGTGRTLKVPASAAGGRITLIVTGSLGGDFREVRSAAVAVKAATLPALPVTAKATPKVVGKAKVGKKVTASLGAWPAGTTLHYQWLSNGKAIKGATKKSLTLTKKLKGKKVSVRVTGTKPGYATTVRTSKAVKVS